MKKLVLTGAAAAALVASLGLTACQSWRSPNGISNTSQSQEDARGLCADKVRYYANEPGKAGPNDNGPAYKITGNTKEEQIQSVLDERHIRRCDDPVLVVEHEFGYGFTLYSNLEARIRQLLADRDEWRGAVNRLEALEAKAIEKDLGVTTRPYWSLYMVPGSPPKIGQDSEVEAKRSTLLRLVFAPGALPNGEIVIDSRIDCGDQIYRLRQFRDIWVIKPSSTPSVTTTPGTTSGTTPGTSTRSTPPATSTTPGEPGKNTGLDPAPQGINTGKNGQGPTQADPEGPPGGGPPPLTDVKPPALTPTTVPRPTTSVAPVSVEPEPSHSTAPPVTW